MKVRELIELLKEENQASLIKDVFSKPAFDAVRKAAIACKTKKERLRRAQRPRHVSQEQLDYKELVSLCQTWIHKPAEFLSSWWLPTQRPTIDTAGQAHDGSQPNFVRTENSLIPVLNTCNEANVSHIKRIKDAVRETIVQLRQCKADQKEKQIRRIVYAVSLRDAVLSAFDTKDHLLTKDHLPTKDLKEALAQTWKRLTGEALPDSEVDETLNFVKEGQRYCVIGRFVGEGSWLLLPDLVAEKCWSNVKSSEDNFASLKEAFDNLDAAASANDAATAIRKFMSHPYYKSKELDLTHLSEGTQPSKCPASTSIADLQNHTCLPLEPTTAPFPVYRSDDILDLGDASNRNMPWTVPPISDHDALSVTNLQSMQDLPPVDQQLWDNHFVTPNDEVRHDSAVGQYNIVSSTKSVNCAVPPPNKETWDSIFLCVTTPQGYNQEVLGPDRPSANYAQISDQHVVSTGFHLQTGQGDWSGVFPGVPEFNA